VRVTSFSITQGETIVSAIASANVIASPIAEMSATTCPIMGIASSAFWTPNCLRTATATLVYKSHGRG
jgi:hypothetical protein